LVNVFKNSSSTTGKGTKTTYYFYDGSQLLAEADDQGKVENPIFG
jgi:hypothetical protein